MAAMVDCGRGLDLNERSSWSITGKGGGSTTHSLAGINVVATAARDGSDPSMFTSGRDPDCCGTAMEVAPTVPSGEEGRLHWNAALRAESRCALRLLGGSRALPSAAVARPDPAAARSGQPNTSGLPGRPGAADATDSSFRGLTTSYPTFTLPGVGPRFDLQWRR